MNEEQKTFSRERDKEDGRVLLRATLDFLGMEVGREEGIIDRRNLPADLNELVGEMERELQIPIVCRSVKE